MRRLIASDHDVTPAVNDIDQYAIERWPIPEALRYIQYEPQIPSALAIIGFVAALHKGMWPAHFGSLDQRSRTAFIALTLLLECQDELYPAVVADCKANNLQSLCDFAEGLRPTVRHGPKQFDFSFNGKKNSIDNVEWYYEDIISSMKRIYGAGIRGYGGSVSGIELQKLVQSFRIPELWHEVVIAGRRPDGPFEIMSWIASQRECDLGTALKIMHIIALDAIEDSASKSPEAKLVQHIIGNFKKNYYKTSNFAGTFSNGAQLGRMSTEEIVNFFISQRLEKAQFSGRDLPLSNDGFGIVLGITEHPKLELGTRMAVNAFQYSQPRGILTRTFQYLRGGKP